MSACTAALNKNVEITEYDAVGINIAKKLEKMDQHQRIYADMLTSRILGRGLLNTLTAKTDLFENRPYHGNIPMQQPISINTLSPIESSKSSISSDYHADPNNLYYQSNSVSPKPSDFINVLSESLNNWIKIMYYGKITFHC